MDIGSLNQRLKREVPVMAENIAVPVLRAVIISSVGLLKLVFCVVLVDIENTIGNLTHLYGYTDFTTGYRYRGSAHAFDKKGSRWDPF
jgi:uncharacterized membrane protein